MKIKVTEQNRAKIEEAIAAVQSKARVRTISADTVFDYCERLKDTYRMIPKIRLNDSRFHIDANAQNFPNAYKGIPESTQFVLVYKNSYFYLVDVLRTRTSGESFEITAGLSDGAKTALLAAYTYPVKYGL